MVGQLPVTAEVVVQWNLLEVKKKSDLPNTVIR